MEESFGDVASDDFYRVFSGKERYCKGVEFFLVVSKRLYLRAYKKTMLSLHCEWLEWKCRSGPVFGFSAQGY